MGVVIEICVKHPGGPTRMTVTDIYHSTPERKLTSVGKWPLPVLIPVHIIVIYYSYF
jgi:hypothetical protein